MHPTGSATLMPVRDLARSLTFYVTVLGFRKQFEYGGFYAGVEWGVVQLHLNVKGRASPGSGDVYIFCDAVDQFYDDIVKRGANVETPPETHDYGMRDFVAIDPDGNRISFGAMADGAQGS